MYSRSHGFMSMRRLPNPHKSLKPGCAPMLTPAATAWVTTRCIVTGSPAWNPQAMLAERMILSSPASSPMSYAPNPSPISALRLIAFAMLPPLNRAATLPGESMKVRFLAAGDRALVVEFGDCIDRALSAEVLHLDASLGSSGLAGIVETVPTFRSLMVHYDPLVTTRADLQQAIASPARATPALCAGCRSVTTANSHPTWPMWLASPGSRRARWWHCTAPLA